MGGLNKQTYCEQVVDFIRAKILAGELSPLSPVKEAAIADELSISRAPVREAMQILVREGLIEGHPQKRKYVRALTAKQIRNSYFTGGVLEAAAVAAVVECYSDEDIAALESIVARMLAVARQSGSVAEQAPLDDAFHDLLFTRVDNELVVELCKRSCQGISKFLLFKHWVKLFPAQMVYERHLEIVTAIKSRDQALVESVIRAHYISSGEKMAAFGVDVYCAAA
jgi:DNA-binding GntR family transcriptional regulator